MPILTKPQECTGCPLWEEDKQGFIRGEGTGSNHVLIVGEAGGFHEKMDGLPFRPHAPAGSVLERAIRRYVGGDRSPFRIINTCNCTPPRDWLEGAPWEYGSIVHCETHRTREIQAMKPRAILALGGVAFRTMTGLSGKGQTITAMRGFPIVTEFGPVIGSLHPAFIMRGNMRMLGVLGHDLLLTLKIARDGPMPYETHYNMNPSPIDVGNFVGRVKDNPNQLLAYDIETPETEDGDEELYGEKMTKDSRITSIQFSLAPGEGIYLPWNEFTQMATQDIMAMPNPKAGHNVWRFDNPKLRSHGIQINGVVHDTMWMFHHIQPDLSGFYNLQSVASFYGMPFPWKHLKDSEPQHYGCADVDAVQRIMAKLPGDLRARGAWRGYEEHYLKLERVLIDMMDRGIPVDEEQRQALDAQLTEQKRQYFAAMQDLVPNEIKPFTPAKGYVKGVKTREGYIEEDGLGGYQWFDEESGQWFPMRQRVFTAAPEAGGGGEEPPSESRWVRCLPFLPSSKQVLAYIKHKGHPIPRKAKEDKDTSEAKALEKLFTQTKDPLYRTILDYRGVEKLQSTYVEGWKPYEDGRVHCEFLYAPATGQLSSRNPNAQNVPKHNSLAASFRRIIKAPGAYQVVEFDYKSFHALTLGFEAGDPDYMRLARIDIHSYLTAGMMKEPASLDWPDEQLADYLRYIRKKYQVIRDTKAKRAILGYGFGMGARRLFKENQDIYSNTRDAQMVIDNLNGLFPKTARFREDIKEQAHRQSYLISRHGYVRWFHDVKRWDPKTRQWIGGDDAEKAIAFLPANDAFGHIKDVMLRLHDEHLCHGLINTVHDSLVFLLPDDELEETIRDVRIEMERPSTVLVDPRVAPNGLSVAVEVKAGPNWNDMKEIKL